ncbi:VOC family protein [Brevibacillus centrosporus]|uniref:Catechol 2,3-dioxygenase n=1 Tax=Brevibacillus centrosporus TaxID=54910 RepID=A0A1I4B0F2_9BACL|nr:VOC family protein [Brevibacillus centrosporus]MED4907867.1 VOC family protein [Brevibacillus centrosporus]SFK61647.1 Catechol 2,3-dioxygenase [Brevibacillus centrosporus]
MSAFFKRIDTVFVPTRDVDRALDWYVTVLGGTPGWRSEKGEYQSVTFSDTSITLFLTSDENEFTPRHCAFNFYAPRAEAAYQHLVSHQVKVEEIAEWGAKYFVFYDLDGNRLEVCEY